MKKIYLFVLFIFCFLVDEAQITTQLSYFNTSRGGGGPVSTTDIIEIRAVISVQNPTVANDITFTGAVPVGTTYIAGSLQAKTNEAVITGANTGNYTDAAGDDRADYNAATGTIRINMGTGAGIPPAIGGDIIGGSTVPRFSNTATIIQATFRVRVNLLQGSIITLGGNAFTYNGGSVGLGAISIFVSYPNSCASFNPGNLVTVETGGTFGSGTTQNRSASANTSGFTYISIASNAPGDGFYSVVKNTSSNQAAQRVFNVFDIYGDHTGTSTSAGNPGSASGANGGYMLLVNATYAPSVVFSTSVSGLIPGMDYTIRFWVRNICGTCGQRPDGSGGSGTPGVLPHLIFSVNGSDRYTTGTVAYGVGWVEHTFTFNSGTNTVANLVIRNNAPGGGGNDWTIDDISLFRCLIILPETVDQISAERVGDMSVIKWSISNDQALQDYVVQFSEDGKTFYDGGIVSATGKGGKYSYNDTRALYNKLYYRIKSITKSREERYSKTVVLRAGSQSLSSLNITPNPAIQSPTIQFSTIRRGIVTLTLIDGVGRAVTQKTINAESGINSHTLDSKLKAGVYTVVVDFGQGDIRRERMVIIDK